MYGTCLFPPSQDRWKQTMVSLAIIDSIAQSSQCGANPKVGFEIGFLLRVTCGYLTCLHISTLLIHTQCLSEQLLAGAVCSRWLRVVPGSLHCSHVRYTKQHITCDSMRAQATGVCTKTRCLYKGSMFVQRRFVCTKALYLYKGSS